MKVVIRVLIVHVTLTLPPLHSYQSMGGPAIQTFGAFSSCEC